MKRPQEITSTDYNRRIGLPVIRSIRAAEDAAVINVFRKHVRPIDSILEIGPGTGFYTMRFASAAKELTAVDSNPSMVKHLKGEVERKNPCNIDIVCCDFLNYNCVSTYDWVIAVGVLEYQKNPMEFFDRLIALSHKWILVTLPTPGAWGKIYRTASRLQGTHINLFSKSEIQNQYNSSVVHIEDVGLKSRVSGGLTLVCLLERKI